MFKILFAWPDQLPSFNGSDHLVDCYISFRLQNFQHSQNLLISYLALSPNNIDALFLLGFLTLRQPSPTGFTEVLDRLKSLLPDNHPYISFLFVQNCLQIVDIPSLLTYDHLNFNKSKFWPLHLSSCALSLHLGNTEEALNHLESLPSHARNCLEALRLESRCLEQHSDYLRALDILVSASKRFPGHLPLRTHMLDVAIKARSQEHTLPILNKLIADFPFYRDYLTSLSQVRLLQNKTADSLFLILKNRVWNSIVHNQEHIASNLYNCYDRLGNVDWLQYTPFLLGKSCKLPLQVKENLCMQAASFEMKQYPAAINDVISDYSNLSSSVLTPYRPSNTSDKSLTVAWLCADISYHPVGRFLFSLLSRLVSPIHTHILVDTLDHGAESSSSWFSSIPNLDVITLNGDSVVNRVDTVRDLGADIAVDLSGWTSGHFMRGFYHRLASVQVSYLGYFASTGIPSMDYWMGDHNLFPSPMVEWHSENIFRLPRCFLAWDPPDILPESNVQVVPSAYSPDVPIRFGSFNNHRKLSFQTLRQWGLILSSIPGSALVLKAGHSDDPSTSLLLAKRMSDAGLDTSSIIWLPRTRSSKEHLEQYSYIDVALDCFPNGGCTTTCEAIWMGVPVITLSGSSYVSRMSTAVLHGAGMSEWCTNSFDDYIRLAASSSQRVAWLRSHRDLWREKLQSNSLGDATKLLSHIEAAFSHMHSSLS